MDYLLENDAALLLQCPDKVCPSFSSSTNWNWLADRVVSFGKTLLLPLQASPRRPGRHSIYKIPRDISRLAPQSVSCGTRFALGTNVCLDHILGGAPCILFSSAFLRR